MRHHETLLERFSVLRSFDLDEARAAVSKKYCDHQLDLKDGSKMDVRHNHVRGVHVSLNVLSYGADVAINPGELRDFYLLQLPLQGCARIVHRGEEVDANPFCGTLLNPDRQTHMLWRHDCRKVMVQLDAGYLNRVASEEAGMELPGAVRFEPRVLLGTPSGRRIRALTLAAARYYEGGRVDPNRRNLRLLSLERQLAVTCLHEQPSNISHLLEKRVPPCLDVSLKRSVAFIRAQAHDAIALDEIAAAARVHPRTLQVAFRKTLGVSPSQFLRDTRLDNARYHLKQRNNRANVSAIAYECGYSHLGRFSRDYRVRFGHAPSETE